MVIIGYWPWGRSDWPAVWLQCPTLKILRTRSSDRVLRRRLAPAFCRLDVGICLCCARCSNGHQFRFSKARCISPLGVSRQYLWFCFGRFNVWHWHDHDARLCQSIDHSLSQWQLKSLDFWAGLCRDGSSDHFRNTGASSSNHRQLVAH